MGEKDTARKVKELDYGLKEKGNMICMDLSKSVLEVSRFILFLLVHWIPT